MKSNIILAVESSCDETGVAICRGGLIVANLVATQTQHAIYGGVVPEVAARAHLEGLPFLLRNALKEAHISLREIDIFAYTKTPGLIGCLLVGEAFITALALMQRKNAFPIHHIEAHILANLIDSPQLSFPLLCLCVSGGHTQIILCEDVHHFRVLAYTLDDAAGEAFDKIAKMLGLPYPGGKHIDSLAQKGSPIFSFPSPLLKEGHFSFSGLKTAVKYFLAKEEKQQSDFIKTYVQDICASVQTCIVKALLTAFFAHATQYPQASLCLAGGVAANSLLRTQFMERAIKQGRTYSIPKLAYCLDNAAMIAIAAYYQIRAKKDVF